MNIATFCSNYVPRSMVLLRLAATISACACQVIVIDAPRAADVVSTWNGTTGVWSDASRWDSIDFPDNGNGGFTYDAVVAGGTVSLDQVITLEDLELFGGTIDGAGTLHVSENIDWFGGGFAGTGLEDVFDDKLVLGHLPGGLDLVFDASAHLRKLFEIVSGRREQ